MDTPDRRTIRGATAFNEMAILEREGRRGYHLVDVGIARLDVEASDRPWEHLRLIAASPSTIAALQESGWRVVGSWGLFTYLKRPTPGRGGGGHR